jgi:hypothetical protein
MAKRILLAVSLALAAALGQAQDLGNVDDMFDSAPETPVAEAKTIANPEASILENQGFKWGGEMVSDLDLEIPYRHLPPSDFDEWTNFHQNATFDLGAKLFFDSRPDKNYRVFGKFIVNYPFSSDFKTLNDPTKPYSATNTVNSYSLTNVQVFELFTDFNWKERVFFRFGKQTAGWGLSRFYQVADPLSVGVKDPQNPTDDLEGPVALKVTYPIGLHNLYAYSVLKNSYLPATGQADLRDLGWGIKGDFFVPLPKKSVFGDAEVTAGYYYQRQLAPKTILGVTSSVGDFQIFSDQVFAYGSDRYRLDSNLVPTTTGTVNDTSKNTTAWYYSATAGAMYKNDDEHLTLYGEYLFNGLGSTDGNYLKKLENRYIAEQVDSSLAKNTSTSDLFSYNSAHNTGFSASLSEMFGSDKFSSNLFWQQNWIDRSGMVVPSFTFTPWKYFSVSLGTKFIFGGDESEFILKNAGFTTGSLDPAVKRLAPYIKIYFGANKF